MAASRSCKLQPLSCCLSDLKERIDTSSPGLLRQLLPSVACRVTRCLVPLWS